MSVENLGSLSSLDLNTTYTHSTLAHLWRTYTLPHFGGIVIGDGRMIERSAANYYLNDRVRHSVAPVAETCIDRFQKDRDAFVELTPFISRTPISGTEAYAICGEGAMGNEGFVALVNPHGLVWAGFFDCSNPFYEVCVSGDAIVGRTSYDVKWSFTIDRPWDIRIQYLQP